MHMKSINDKPALSILYVFYGEKYLAEYIHSVSSLLRTNIVRVNVVSSFSKDKIPYLNGDYIFQDENDVLSGFNYKVKGIELFVNTTKDDLVLFLDTDTIIDCDVTTVFELLSEYPILAAREPLGSSFESCKHIDRPNWKLDEVETHEELNTGVIFFNLRKLTDLFFRAWSENHNELTKANSGIQTGTIPDQLSFIETIKKLEIKHFILSNRFNFRPYYVQMITNFPLIYHGHNAKSYYANDETKRHVRSPLVFFPLFGFISEKNFFLKILKFIGKIFR